MVNKVKDVSRLIRQARKSLRVGQSQQELVRAARKALGVTTKQLAQAIDRSEDTINAWLQRPGTAKFRNLPAESRLLLERIIEQHRAEKRGRK